MLFIRHSSLALNISNNIHIAKICSGFFSLISCFDSKLELHRCVVSLLSFARILCIYCVCFFSSLSLSQSQCRCMRFFYSSQNMNTMINLNLFISIWRMHTNGVSRTWNEMSTQLVMMPLLLLLMLRLSSSAVLIRHAKNYKEPIHKRHIRRHS